MDFKGQKSTPYIVDILHQHGIKQVVICPGSRNAPFTLAFARHGGFNCISIVDERSAGYFALGLAQSTGEVVAIVCTSGTAVLNLAPAIAEAYYQQIPLMVLTADRPEAWINQQDGQAIEQKFIYANIIAKSYHLKGELYTAEDLWNTEKVTNEAIHISHSQSRPVHINVSFAEPLYEDDYTRVNARKIALYQTNTFFSYWDKLLMGKNKILVLLGQTNANERIKEAIQQLNANHVVVVAENLSNLPKHTYIPNAAEVISYDSHELNPDVVIYLGGVIVSKQLKKFIRNTNAPVIRVQLNADEVDTFQNNGSLIRQSVADGLESLADHCKEHPIDVDYLAQWKNISDKKKISRDEFLNNSSFCDLKVFEWISKNMQENSTLHLGNSTPVRYTQIFNDHYPANSCFLSNRGTSGIDGSTSTAVGYSYANHTSNILITGDISFQYDANAFFNKYLKGNLKVIVINNSGGNIFRIIDGPREQKECAEFFETSLQHEFSNFAKHFNLNYFSAKDEKELTNVWSDFLGSTNRPSVLEIFTDAEISAGKFKEFYKFLQS